MKKEPFAVLGITGSPVTIGHVKMAEIALESGHFGKVIVLPCSQNRSDKHIGASSFDRWLMSCHGFAELKQRYFKRIVVSNLIVHRKDEIVSLEQLRLLNARDPREYYLCVGSDNVEEHEPGISKVEYFWDRGKPLWNEANWAIFPRPGSVLPTRLPKTHVLLESTALDVSSTLVRTLIETGEPWEHLVPPRVAVYIKSRNLYRKGVLNA